MIIEGFERFFDTFPATCCCCRTAAFTLAAVRMVEEDSGGEMILSGS
jgi:hypothetical protein